MIVVDAVAVVDGDAVDSVVVVVCVVLLLVGSVTLVARVVDGGAVGVADSAIVGVVVVAAICVAVRGVLWRLVLFTLLWLLLWVLLLLCLVWLLLSPSPLSSLLLLLRRRCCRCVWWLLLQLTTRLLCGRHLWLQVLVASRSCMPPPGDLSQLFGTFETTHYHISSGGGNHR